VVIADNNRSLFFQSPIYGGLVVGVVDVGHIIRICELYRTLRIAARSGRVSGGGTQLEYPTFGISVFVIRPAPTFASPHALESLPQERILPGGYASLIFPVFLPFWWFAMIHPRLKSN
jgi:hypothetical protein